MGQSSSSPVITRGKSAGSFNLRREIGRRAYASPGGAAGGGGGTSMLPGAVRTASISRGLRPSSTLLGANVLGARGSLERQSSLEAVCATGSTSMMANASAYSSTRLLHKPRLRLNSVVDGSAAGGDVPTLKERRNSIAIHNQEYLRPLLNMDDEDVEAIGRQCKIYSAVSAQFKPVTKTGRKRRNSSNSIFLTQTTDNILDQKALVKCASAAIHAAVEEAPGRVTRQYSIFVDPDKRFFCRPTFREVYRFVNNIFMKAQLEPEVLIISLVYFERLRLVMESQLVVGYRNWRAIVLACCVLASKVWDDLSMINADFSTIMAKQFTLKQINELEVAMLSALKFDVKVSLSTYALYYFKMRAMLGPGNLFHDDTTPLSIREAQKMKTLSPSFTKRLSITDEGRRRTATIGTNESERARQVSTAALEHIVRLSPRRQDGRGGGDDDDEYRHGGGYRLEVRSSAGAPKRAAAKANTAGSDISEEALESAGDASDSDDSAVSAAATAAVARETTAPAVARSLPATATEDEDKLGDGHAREDGLAPENVTAAAPLTVGIGHGGRRLSNSSSSNNSGTELDTAADLKPRLRSRRRQRAGRERRPELVAVEDTNAVLTEEKQHVEL